MIDEKWVIPLANRQQIKLKEEVLLLCTFLALFIGFGGWICYISYTDGILVNFIVLLSFFIAIIIFIGFWYGRNIYEIKCNNKAYKYTVVYREDEFLILYDHKNRVTKIPYHDVVLIEGRPKSFFAIGPMIASYSDCSYGKLIFTCNNQGRTYKVKVKYVEKPYETAAKMITFYTDNNRSYDTEIEFKGR